MMFAPKQIVKVLYIKDFIFLLDIIDKDDNSFVITKVEKIESKVRRDTNERIKI